MKGIEDGSIDMILCDLPYGTTACKWDTVIPFEPLWEQYKRIIKPNGAIVLFGTQPFTSLLITSNLNLYRYSWVWDKGRGMDFQLAKLRPLRAVEDLCVFSKGKTANGAKLNMRYYPIMTEYDKPRHSGGSPRSKLLHNNSMVALKKTYTEKYPTNILKFKIESSRQHPTQKPVALFEYLIKTYTSEGDTVLDNCIGSGTTAIAAIITKRNFIGFELDKTYYDIANERILKYKEQKQ